jgi:hypothetical protein
VTDLDAAALVGLLADVHRRQVVAAIELGAHHVDDVVRATGLNAAQLAKAMGKLVESGLIVQTADGLSLAPNVFRDAAREAKARPASSEFDDQPDEARKVLRSFVSGGRLKSIPTAASKRAVILDWLAQEFEPGRRYSEQMVNLMLGQHHADTAALRRYLVDGGLLDRAGGEYWRIGGTVGG